MNTVSTWLMSIFGVVLIGTLIDLVLPSGKLNKYLKSIFACMTVLVIILPLPSLFKNGFNPDTGGLITPDFTLDQSYLDYADKYKINALALGTEKQLSQDGYANVKVEIKGKTSGEKIEIELVSINLQNVVIDEKLQHINKNEKVTELVSAYLSIEKGRILIYE